MTISTSFFDSITYYQEEYAHFHKANSGYAGFDGFVASYDTNTGDLILSTGTACVNGWFVYSDSDERVPLLFPFISNKIYARFEVSTKTATFISSQTALVDTANDKYKLLYIVHTGSSISAGIQTTINDVNRFVTDYVVDSSMSSISIPLPNFQGHGLDYEISFNLNHGDPAYSLNYEVNADSTDANYHYVHRVSREDGSTAGVGGSSRFFANVNNLANFKARMFMANGYIMLSTTYATFDFTTNDIERRSTDTMYRLFVGNDGLQTITFKILTGTFVNGDSIVVKKL